MMEPQTQRWLACPLRPCEWRSADVHWAAPAIGADFAMDVLTVPQEMLREHVAADHRDELQLMLAGIDGGRGEPVRVSLVQHVDAMQVHRAEDLVLSVVVPQMRAALARDIARKGLRPLDPWPAVQVHRYVWTTSEQWADRMHNASDPPGMREWNEGDELADVAPDLFTLELATDAVRDTRTVTL